MKLVVMMSLVFLCFSFFGFQKRRSGAGPKVEVKPRVLSTRKLVPRFPFREPVLVLEAAENIRDGQSVDRFLNLADRFVLETGTFPASQFRRLAKGMSDQMLVDRVQTLLSRRIDLWNGGYEDPREDGMDSGLDNLKFIRDRSMGIFFSELGDRDPERAYALFKSYKHGRLNLGFGEFFERWGAVDPLRVFQVVFENRKIEENDSPPLNSDKFLSELTHNVVANHWDWLEKNAGSLSSRQRRRIGGVLGQQTFTQKTLNQSIDFIAPALRTSDSEGNSNLASGADFSDRECLKDFFEGATQSSPELVWEWLQTKDDGFSAEVKYDIAERNALNSSPQDTEAVIELFTDLAAAAKIHPGRLRSSLKYGLLKHRGIEINSSELERMDKYLFSSWDSKIQDKYRGSE